MSDIEVVVMEVVVAMVVVVAMLVMVVFCGVL